MGNDSPQVEPALEARQRVLAARNNLRALMRGELPLLPAYLSATVALLDQAAVWLDGAAE